MTSLGIGIVVKAIAKDVKQSAELNPRMIRWYVVLMPLIDRSTMEIIIIEDKRDMDPVTVGMIIPAFVKSNESTLISGIVVLCLFVYECCYSDLAFLNDTKKYRRN
jgi:hypothetical protein